MKEYPWGKGTPVWVRDATANDSDKSFTVPVGKMWDMWGIKIKIACTATVGNREINVLVSHDGTDYEAYHTSMNVTASQVYTCIMSFGQVTDNFGITIYGSNNAESVGTHGMLLPAGAVIRVYDRAAIDAAADDLTVVLHYVEYDA